MAAEGGLKSEILAGLDSWCAEQDDEIKSAFASVSEEVYMDFIDCYRADITSPTQIGQVSELQYALADYLFQAGPQTKERGDACLQLVFLPLNFLWESIWRNAAEILREEGCAQQNI